VCFVAIAPVFLYDLVKFSHRVAGPLHRCQSTMQEMADGQVVAEFVRRKHDLLQEFFGAFNALIRTCNARVNAAGSENAASALPCAAASPLPITPLTGIGTATEVQAADVQAVRWHRGPRGAWAPKMSVGCELAVH
jgi:hypothetical protein